MDEEKQVLEQQPQAKPQDIEHLLTPELTEAIIAASEAEDTHHLKELLSQLHIADIAECLSSLPGEQRRLLISKMADDFNPDILLELNPDIRDEVLESLGKQGSAEAINQLDTEEAVSIIEDLDEHEQQEILGEVSASIREQLTEGLSYPEDSAGRLMQKRLLAVPEFWTTGQVIDYLRTDQKDVPEDFYEIFVVDPAFRPVGGLLVSRLLRSMRQAPVREIMRPDLRPIPTTMDQEEVAYIFHKYGLVSAPVVGDDGRLVGMISIEHIVDVIDEEAEEDILRLGGVSESDISVSVFTTVQRRFPWLLSSIFTSLIISMLIGIFAESISHIVALAVLMPIIAAVTSIAATQTSTITVRSIARKELTSQNFFSVLGKEALTGMMNGCVFGLLAAVTVWFRYHDMHLTFVFGLSLFLAMLSASLVGSLVPVALEKCGVDPAIASSVCINSITDTISFVGFLALATIFLL